MDPLQGGPINEGQDVILEAGARSDRAAAIIGKAGWFAFERFRTPGWSLPPTHPRAFELIHDSTTSESRGIGGRVNNARFVANSGALDLLRVQGFKIGTRVR